MHITFVACNRNRKKFRSDPSFIYRCENLAAALSASGHSVSFTHITRFPVTRRSDVVVFHRPRFSFGLFALLFLLKHVGTIVVADMDDLIFDPDLADHNPGVLNAHVSKQSIRTLYASHRRALARFDHVTVSTEPLAAEMYSRFPGVSVGVIPNAVSRTWLEREVPTPYHDKPKVITYFPGTRGHDRDFAVAAGGVERFLAEHVDARLEVTGPLRFELRARAGQVSHRSKVPFDEYSFLFRDAWANLAPLEQTPFTRCKSALKVIEASFWNVPTLCSRIPDTERLAGAGALIMDNPEDWHHQLTALCNPERYQRLAHGLREQILDHADIDDMAQRFLRFVVPCSRKLEP